MSEVHTNAGTPAPDPSWKELYKAGGISALLYVVLALLVPGVMVLTRGYDLDLSTEALLQFIAVHKTWWTTLQMLVLGTSVFAIVAFTALFVALKHVDKSRAAVGAVVACICQVLFMAYCPVLLGLVHLSNHYVVAGAAQQQGIVIAAEALLAQNNAFNPVYEAVFAVGVLIISCAMLKSQFPRWVAMLGIANGPAAIIALSLWPVLGVFYFWWWSLFVVWFVAVGLRLYQFGRA